MTATRFIIGHTALLGNCLLYNETETRNTNCNILHMYTTV
jgi:hypothetical protein